MAKACKTCGGRGSWQETEYDKSADTTTYVWKTCGDCRGTGVDQDPEESESFDIGGGSDG